MIDDIEDNYAEYLNDERGYAWDAWDVLAANVIRRHDAIAEASMAELDELDPASLDDLDRWAFARASRSLGKIERYFDAARLILASTDDHRGIDYADVFVDTIEMFAVAGLGDEALLHLRTFRERWPEDRRAVRLGAFVGAHTGTIESAVEAAIQDAGDDAELLYEIAEDLSDVDALVAADVLRHVERLAAEQDLRSLALDADLLRRALTTE